jgi:hypothetical protein
MADSFVKDQAPVPSYGDDGAGQLAGFNRGIQGGR